MPEFYFDMKSSDSDSSRIRSSNASEYSNSNASYDNDEKNKSLGSDEMSRMLIDSSSSEDSTRQSFVLLFESVDPDEFDSFFRNFASIQEDLDQFDIDDDEINGYGHILQVFSFIMGCSAVDLHELISEMINVSTIRRNEWDLVVSSLKLPKTNRRIVDLEDSAAYFLTRFKTLELQRLNDALFGSFPTDRFKFKKNVFTCEETVLIALTYMAHGSPYQMMSYIFGGDWTRYSLIVNWFAKFLFHKYYHRLRGRSFEYWFDEDNLLGFRNAIYDYVVLDDDGNRRNGCEAIDREIFRIFGWIDCMMLVCCTPGGGPVDKEDNRREDFYEIQRAFFTNYGHMWGMKLQGVLLPNGMMGSIFTASIAQNDKGVHNISGLSEELRRLLAPFPVNGNILPALYADDIYEPTESIVKRTNTFPDFHKRMTKSRIDVEHLFGDGATKWKRLNIKHTWHLLSAKERIHQHYFAIFFMMNLDTCMRENKTAVKYNIRAPTLESYLDVTPNDWYDGLDKDETMIRHLETQN